MPSPSTMSPPPTTFTEVASPPPGGLLGARPPPAETRVLDVGGGLGGPARTLAVKYGCRVTVIDLTESYVRAGELLTERLRLGDRVSHRVGDALELPFPAGTFDIVWTQNSGMNIADKERLYAGFHRVLRRAACSRSRSPWRPSLPTPSQSLSWATRSRRSGRPGSGTATSVLDQGEDDQEQTPRRKRARSSPIPHTARRISDAGLLREGRATPAAGRAAPSGVDRVPPAPGPHGSSPGS